MTLRPDDPKWTAYALGEIEEAERQLLSTELIESDETRVAVEEIEELARQLTEGLRGEDSPGLTEVQRLLIRQAATDQEKSRPRRSIVMVGLPVAACLFLTISVYVL